MRNKKDAALRKAMCERFIAAVNMLGLTPTDTYRQLGYANGTTIAKVRRGQSFVDAERLFALANLTTVSGKHINLDWLIAGRGPCEKSK